MGKKLKTGQRIWIYTTPIFILLSDEISKRDTLKRKKKAKMRRPWRWWFMLARKYKVADLACRWRCKAKERSYSEHTYHKINDLLSFNVINKWFCTVRSILQFSSSTTNYCLRVVSSTTPVLRAHCAMEPTVACTPESGPPMCQKICY